MHNHPDTFIHKCDATTQTDFTTIRPKPFPRNLSNRARTLIEKEKLVSYWPSDDNDSTDDELQEDPPEAVLHTKHLLTSHSELSFTRRSQVTQHTDAAHHQPSGPIDRPSTLRRLQPIPIAAEKHPTSFRTEDPKLPNSPPLKQVPTSIQ